MNSLKNEGKKFKKQENQGIQKKNGKQANNKQEDGYRYDYDDASDLNR